MNKHFRIETEIHSLFCYCCLVVLFWRVIKIKDFSTKEKWLKIALAGGILSFIKLYWWDDKLFQRWQIHLEMNGIVFWKYFFQDIISQENICAFSLRRILARILVFYAYNFRIFWMFWERNKILPQRKFSKPKFWNNAIIGSNWITGCSIWHHFK